MSELIQPKQIEALVETLATIIVAQQTADEAKLLALQALEILGNIPGISTPAKEIYSNIIAAPTEAFQINVENNVKNANNVQVFIHGVLVASAFPFVGTNKIQINVPYQIVESDQIVIYYTY